MQRTYLRYEAAETFGVIAAPRGNCIYAEGDQLALTPALRDVGVWHLKQGSLVRRLRPETTGGAATTQDAAEEVSCLRLLPEGRVAAGYTSGVLRVFSYGAGAEQRVALHGHRSEVTTVSATSNGAFLASGAKDTDVVVWDVIAETGLCRLRGHRGAVTSVAFLEGQAGLKEERGGNGFFGLVSASQDALVKVWDISAQHCLQTLSGHHAEVWALALNPSATRLVTGSEDTYLRVFAVEEHKAAVLKPSVAETSEEGESTALAQPLGAMGRVARQLTDKVSQLAWHPSGCYLGILVPGKALEVFYARSDEESQRKMKRRLKRQRSSKAGGEEAADAEAGAQVSAESPAESRITAGDELESFALLRSTHKIRSFAFQNSGATAAKHTSVLLSLHNNSLEVHRLPLRQGKRKGSVALLAVDGAGGVPRSGPDEALPARSMVVDMHGHRSDVRSVALSRDAQLVASASAYSVKVWNAASQSCIRSAAMGGLALCCDFAPGDRHVLVGTKEGCLCLMDIGSGDVTENVQAHQGAVWDLALRPDHTGFATASADKSVKFWDFELQANGQLGLVHTRTLKLTEDALCVAFSHAREASKLLVCVSLLDSTVKVFYDDALRFFLSLYGHKLPALCMSISSDDAILATGSADKTIKIWGLDFGDCHKSLFAHDDSIMGLRFVHDTHLFFSVSKDRTLKYWDADSYDNVLVLRGHSAEVWALAVSRDGASVVTGSHDRSLRLWARTQEPVFIEEERERELDRVFEGELNRDRRGDDEAEDGEDDGEQLDGASQATTKRSLDTITSGERLLEALEIAWGEWSVQQAYARAKADAEAISTTAPEPPRPSILLLGLSPVAYVLRAFRMVKAQHLEQALLVASFFQVEIILSFCAEILRTGLAVETVARTVVLLLRTYTVQIAASAKLRPVLVDIQRHLRPELRRLRNLLGVNHAALEFVQRAVQDKGSRTAPRDEESLPLAIGDGADGAEAGGVRKARKKARKQ